MSFGTGRNADRAVELFLRERERRERRSKKWKEGKKKKLLSPLSHFSFSFPRVRSFSFSFSFLKGNHGQPHRRAGRGVQSTSSSTRSASWSRAKWSLNGWRGAAAERPPRDGRFSMPVRRRLLASSLSLSLPLFDISFGSLAGIQEISIRSVHKHAIRAWPSSERRSLEGQVRDERDTRAIDASRLTLISPLFSPNRRPLPSSTRTATGPSRPRSWAPSCARWARTRRRRSCR